MPSETDRKMMEILRILSDKDKVLGAKTIAEELGKKGYILGERAVRYHMRILDEKEFTERIGYAGRKITDKGLKELEKALIYDQVDFAFSRFEGMIYQTDLDVLNAKGSVVVNKSLFEYDKEIMEQLKEVFKKGLAVSPYVNIKHLDTGKKEDETEGDEIELRDVTGLSHMIELRTICGTTIDGMLLKNGIPVIPQYGGIVKIKDYVPVGFTELIAYKKTSITPLDAFTAPEMTSVLQVVEEGSGIIPANFRVIPASAKDKTKKLLGNLQKIGISGLLKMGEDGESVLGVPVENDMIGIAIIGGITPLCAIKETGNSVNIELAGEIMEFGDMEKIVAPKPALKSAGSGSGKKVKFLLSKAWNLINNVELDIESLKGNVIINISYLKNEDLDEALEIMNRLYHFKPAYCTTKFFKLLPHRADDDKTGIATVCSLTVDGILIKNGISTLPQYGGILEIEKKEPRFVELTAYSGSSLDPHEIYISKDMTSVSDAIEGRGRILASLKEIPYLARSDAIDILEKIQNLGFSILKVGETNELVYNSKVERYHVGIVTPGGLNPIAAIKEQGIPVEVKAVETLMDLSEMDEF